MSHSKCLKFDVYFTFTAQIHLDQTRVNIQQPLVVSGYE